VTHRPRFGPALGGIAAVAAAVRIAFTAIVDPQTGRLSDASAYHLLAHDVAHHFRYVRPFDHLLLHVERPTAEYPPLYPAFLAVFDRLGLHGVDAQELVAGTLVGTATVILVGLLGRRIGGAATGLVAAAIAACYPMLFQADAVLMTEGLFALLTTAALILAVDAVQDPVPRRVAALGAVCGLAALTRTEGLLLGATVVAGVAVAARARARPARTAAVGLGMILLLVAPWTLRNAVRFHTFVPVSNNLGTVVDGANCPLTYSGPQIGLWRAQLGEGGASDFECFQGFHIEDPRFDEAEAARAHLREGLRYARAHRGRLSVVVPARVLRTFALWPDQAAQIRTESFEGRESEWQWAGTVGFWVLVPAAVVGVFATRRPGSSRRPLWPLAVPVAVVVVTSALTYGNQRFRIGAEPSSVVLAAVGVVALVRRASARLSDTEE
jgi:4-amino-4-deoxy-L-arabinose transferase-like glycosyltransferase